MKKILFLFVFLLAFFPIFKQLYLKKDYYFSPFDLDRARGFYEISQYVKGEGATWIADEILFAYAGWKYIHGGNPILLNPENPPLGKYLIGISIYLFNSEKLPTLLFSFLSLLSFYLLAALVLKNKYLALLPVVLFSWGRLFQEQLVFLPLFELFALPFLVFCLYFFIKGLEKPIFFSLSHLFLGALWATRPWMATVPLILSFLIFLLFFERKLEKIVSWLLFSPLSIIVLLASYYRLFLDNHSLVEVLKVQKWILWYHQSRVIKIGSVFPFVFANRWYVWWGEVPVIKIPQWSFLWPIFTSLALFLSLIVFLKKLGLRLFSKLRFSKEIQLLSLWEVFYLGFLVVGNINVRYVFYLLPFVYLSGTYLVYLFFLKLKLK